MQVRSRAQKRSHFGRTAVGYIRQSDRTLEQSDQQGKGLVSSPGALVRDTSGRVCALQAEAANVISEVASATSGYPFVPPVSADQMALPSRTTSTVKEAMDISAVQHLVASSSAPDRSIRCSKL